MPTRDEIVKEYIERLKKTPRYERVFEFKRIVLDVDTLCYEQTGVKISNEDKLQIYEAIKSQISFLVLDESRVLGTYACSNDELMNLVNSVIGKLKAR